jgi:hypothetical protein
MARVALCLSGQPRSLSLATTSIKKHIVDFYNADVFCHAWHLYEQKKYKNYYNESDPSHYGQYSFDSIVDICENYQPKSLTLEHPCFLENTKSMIYSMCKAIKAKSDYERSTTRVYDIVIRTRYDLKLYEDFTLPEIKNNTLYLKNRPGGCGGVNDWLTVGTSETIDKMGTMFDKYKDSKRITQPCPEGIFLEFFNSCGINVEVICNNFNIIRENGDLVI